MMLTPAIQIRERYRARAASDRELLPRKEGLTGPSLRGSPQQQPQHDSSHNAPMIH